MILVEFNRKKGCFCSISDSSENCACSISDMLEERKNKHQEVVCKNIKISRTRQCENMIDNDFMKIVTVWSNQDIENNIKVIWLAAMWVVWLAGRLAGWLLYMHSYSRTIIIFCTWGILHTPATNSFTAYILLHLSHITAARPILTKALPNFFTSRYREHISLTP